jgi:hypothetical protein
VTDLLNHKTGSGSAAKSSGSTEEQGTRELSPPGASRLQGFPFHPLLFAAFPILNLYVHNIEEVPLQQIWRPLGLALLGSMMIWVFVSLLTRHVRKAALIASPLILAFFSYGHVANLLPDGLYSAAVPACIVGLLILLLILFKSRGTLVHATNAMNLAAGALLILNCLAVIPRLITKMPETAPPLVLPGDRFSPKGGGTQDRGDHTPAVRRPKAVSAAEAAKLPDIYYIVLDAYGRSDSLKTFYGYDNTPFLHALEERGFYISRHSRANYAQTDYCLPTSLNMNYLDGLLQTHGAADNLFETLRRMIDENAVVDYLRNLGYHYVNIWTGSSVTQVDTADLKLYYNSVNPPSTFEGQVLGLTALSAAPQTLAVSSGIAADYDLHRAYLLSAFHHLDSVATLPYPKFVFAHILAPHPPFVFGPNGEAVHPSYPYNEADGSQLLRIGRISREEYKLGYISQLRYINRRVLEAVDAILQQSARPPIIILQGDHGSRMNLDWDSQEKTDLREPFSILNAYFVPPRVRRNLYDSITPVNSFRILLNSLFGAHYPPLPDRSFFAVPNDPLHFREVTDLIPKFTEEASSTGTVNPWRGRPTLDSSPDNAGRSGAD